MNNQKILNVAHSVTRETIRTKINTGLINIGSLDLFTMYTYTDIDPPIARASLYVKPPYSNKIVKELALIKGKLEDKLICLIYDYIPYVRNLHESSKESGPLYYVIIGEVYRNIDGNLQKFTQYSILILNHGESNTKACDRVEQLLNKIKMHQSNKCEHKNYQDNPFEKRSFKIDGVIPAEIYADSNHAYFNMLCKEEF
jgi:hypothetical protein